MNGFMVMGVIVGICVGFWQLVFLYVGFFQGWELLGIIGFVVFCSFYVVGGGKLGFIRSLVVNYFGMVWVFFVVLVVGWLVFVSGLFVFWVSVIIIVFFLVVVVW